MRCDCPQCGSRNTKAFSVIYGNGARTSLHARNGWHTFRGGFGVHSSVTTGETATAAAQMAAPPERLVNALMRPFVIAFILVAGPMLWGFLGFIIAIGVVFLLHALLESVDAESHRRKFVRWQNTFRCGRCGLVFEAQSRESLR